MEPFPANKPRKKGGWMLEHLCSKAKALYSFYLRSLSSSFISTPTHSATSTKGCPPPKREQIDLNCFNSNLGGKIPDLDMLGAKTVQRMSTNMKAFSTSNSRCTVYATHSSSMSKPLTYITHNTIRQPTVRPEMWVCYASSG